jgi:hypothetical protein
MKRASKRPCNVFETICHKCHDCFKLERSKEKEIHSRGRRVVKTPKTRKQNNHRLQDMKMNILLLSILQETTKTNKTIIRIIEIQKET